MRKELNKYIDKFKNNVMTIDYQRRGILPSEGFVVCAISDALNLDIIIESGIANGISTEIFAKYGIPKIIGIERAIKEKEIEMFNSSKKRLSKYKNVELIKGDSFDILSKLIEKNKDLKIGIVIDGPKGTAACNLLKICMQHSNVEMGVIHDQRQREMKRYFKNSIFTDNKIFSDYDFLDNGINIEKPIYGISIKKDYKWE